MKGEENAKKLIKELEEDNDIVDVRIFQGNFH